MDNEIKNYIKNNLLFENVNIEEFDFSSIEGALVFKKNGEFIIKSDSLAEKFYLIIEGEVTTSRKGIKTVLKENHFLGKEAAKGEPVYGYIAVADRDALLLELSSEEAMLLISQDAKLSENLEKEFDGVIHSDEELEQILEEKPASNSEKEALTDFPEHDEKQKIIETKFDSVKAADIIASVFESPAHFSTDLLNDIYSEIEDENIKAKLSAIGKRLELIEDASVKARLFSALPDEYQTEILDAGSLLDEFAENYSGRIPCEIKVETKNEIKIKVNKESFFKAITQVVENACEAMENKEAINITFEENSTLAEILISDPGKGIPLELNSKIFEPYFSFEKENHIGLGLAITDKIIEANNGKVAVKSSNTNGTVISISLPLPE